MVIRDIKGLFCAKYHPDIKNKKATEDDILNEFNETFDTHHNMFCGNKSLEVSLEEFVDYYNIVSSLIDSDEVFEELILNSYKLNKINSPQR